METKDLLEEVRMRLLSLESRAAVAESGASSAKAAAEAAEKRALDAEERRAEANDFVAGLAEILDYPAPHDLLDKVRALKARCADTERELAGSVAIVEAVAEALGLSRHGGDDLPAAVRVLKMRCEGAELGAAQWRGLAEGLERQLELDAKRAAGAMDGGDYVSDLRRHLDAAQRLAHDETVRADGWKERATVAESALAERNREVDLLKRQAQSAGEVRDSLIEQIDAQRDLANTLREQLARRNAVIDDVNAALGVAQWPDNLAAAVRMVREERDSLKAQAESLRGGADWRIGMHGVNHDASMRIIRPLVAALPSRSPWLTCSGCMYWRRDGASGICSMAKASGGGGRRDEDAHCSGWTKKPEPSPSPKTGRWKCRRCGVEMTSHGESPAIFWRWDPDASKWLHWCGAHAAGGGTDFPADRIGDAPEVTP